MELVESFIHSFEQTDKLVSIKFNKDFGGRAVNDNFTSLLLQLQEIVDGKISERCSSEYAVIPQGGRQKTDRPQR